jgi:OmpA-OmpF porin, OOP family
VQQNQAELEKQNAALKAQNEALQQQQAQLTEHQAKIAANKAAVDAAIARFGQLDDYYIFDEVTVYFANGKVKVDPKYNPQLQALADKAKTINGYMIEVKGYASSVGSTALNQQLSEDRADAITNILVQQGHIPLTRMLAPGAMGESHQVDNDKTAEGQAENRRVVVRFCRTKALPEHRIGPHETPEFLSLCEWSPRRNPDRSSSSCRLIAITRNNNLRLRRPAHSVDCSGNTRSQRELVASWPLGDD